MIFNLIMIILGLVSIIGSRKLKKEVIKQGCTENNTKTFMNLHPEYVCPTCGFSICIVTFFIMEMIFITNNLNSHIVWFNYIILGWAIYTIINSLLLKGKASIKYVGLTINLSFIVYVICIMCGVIR